MCGIVAITTSDVRPDLEQRVAEMIDTLVHRGPDDVGTAAFPAEGIALGMRRLSILDLDGGQQPMWDERKLHCVVFNGEIYNAAELRDRLVELGHHFKTARSDTEVLVHGYEEWGTRLFAKLNGMFALALWDRPGRRLVIARDRAGEKPLYVATLRGGYAVASELKALLAHPDVGRALDPVALEQYLAFDYVVEPRSILKDVQKLRAGHFAVVTPAGVRPERYWSLDFTERKSDEGALIEEFEFLLDRSVSMRMVADVPVGLLLSGGLDSTTIGYYMRKYSDEVHSYSIGFEEPRFDESEYARIASRHLGTTHHLEIFSQPRVQELVPRIADILDEPMGDQSIFPMYLLSTVVGRDVKVALGGDGSDELLMGYRPYRALRVSSRLDCLPLAVRELFAAVARRLPTERGSLRVPGLEFARRFDASTAQRLLSYLGSFKGDARWVLSKEVSETLPSSVFEEPESYVLDGISDYSEPDNEAIATYFCGYLRNDILVKVDRASMAASLEVRAPFLDSNLIDFLLGVPPSLKLKGLTGKYLLRRLMSENIPACIIERPKVGFNVPLSGWLRSSLAPIVCEYLSADRITAGGVFDPASVRRLVAEHLDGTVDHGPELWVLLQFELWRERWLG